MGRSRLFASVFFFTLISFVASGAAAFQPAPVIVGSIDTPGSAVAVRISGSHAYVAEDTSGLQILDVSDPAAPALVGSFDTPGAAIGLDVSGGYAYVADLWAGLQILDVSDPAAPVLAGSYDVPNPQGPDQVMDVVVQDHYAYVADKFYGLLILDVSDPSVPVLVGRSDAPQRPIKVRVSGSYAYVIDMMWGFRVIDVSDPSAPVEAALLESTNRYGVDISGNHAYLTGPGLEVVDIGNPLVPTLVGTCDTPGTAIGVHVSGDYAYVADSTSGLQIIDIRVPEAPVLAASCDTPGFATGVGVIDNYAYLADGDSGLQVVWIYPPIIRTSAKILGFGPTYGTRRSKSFHVFNDGADPLEVSLLKTTDPAFKVTYPRVVPFVIEPGASAVVKVRYTPAAAGTISRGWLRIMSNDPSRSRVSVKLKGSGI